MQYTLYASVSWILQAVERGHWVLLEDLDCAPLDFLGSLMPLVEGSFLYVVGQGRIHAHKEFRLFATRRRGGKGDFTVESKEIYLNKFWVKIQLIPFTPQELIRVSILLILPEVHKGDDGTFLADVWDAVP